MQVIKVAKITEGRLLPYFRQVNTPTLNTSYSKGSLDIRLNTIADSMYKGNTSLRELLDDYGLDQDHYFIDNKISRILNEPKVIEKLTENHKNGMLLDENMNSINTLGLNARIITFFDVQQIQQGIKGETYTNSIAYFTILEKDYNESNLWQYIKYYIWNTDGNRALLKSFSNTKFPLNMVFSTFSPSTRWFACTLQKYRNPLINLEAMAESDPESFFGMDENANLDKTKKIMLAGAILSSMLKIRKDYSANIYDEVDVDFLRLNDLAARALERLKI